MMKNGLGLLTVCSTAAVLCVFSGLDAAPTPTDLGARLFRVFRIFLEFKDSDIAGMASRDVFRRSLVTAEPCLVEGFSQVDQQLMEPLVAFFETNQNCLPALESKEVFGVKDVILCIDAMGTRFDPVGVKVACKGHSRGGSADHAAAAVRSAGPHSALLKANHCSKKPFVQTTCIAFQSASRLHLPLTVEATLRRLITAMMKNGFGVLTVCSTAALLCAFAGLDAAPTPTDLGARLARVFRTFLEHKDSNASVVAYRNMLLRAWITAEPCLLEGFSQVDPQLMEPHVTFFETDQNCLPAMESQEVLSEKDLSLCFKAMGTRFETVGMKVKDVLLHCLPIEELRRNASITRQEKLDSC